MSPSSDAFASMLRSQTRREFLRLVSGTVAATGVSTLVPSAFAAAVAAQAAHYFRYLRRRRA